MSLHRARGVRSRAIGVRRDGVPAFARGCACAASRFTARRCAIHRHEDAASRRLERVVAARCAGVRREPGRRPRKKSRKKAVFALGVAAFLPYIAAA
jgi:hypothetical protein